MTQDKYYLTMLLGFYEFGLGMAIIDWLQQCTVVVVMPMRSQEPLELANLINTTQ